MHGIQSLRHSEPEDAVGLSTRGRIRCWRLVPALLCTLGALSLAAQDPIPQPKSINELKAFFQNRCVRCHGLDGSAKDPDGRKLGGLDFTKAAQDFRELVGPASEREIRTMVKVIRKGIFFGRVMPSWKEYLSREEADLMVREVLLKAERGKVIEPDPNAVKPS